MESGDALIWKKSSRSAINGNCVEVARFSERDVGVRDSKDQAGPVLVFGHAEWTAFVDRVKDGEFDL